MAAGGAATGRDEAHGRVRQGPKPRSDAGPELDRHVTALAGHLRVLLQREEPAAAGQPQEGEGETTTQQ